MCVCVCVCINRGKKSLISTLRRCSPYLFLSLFHSLRVFHTSISLQFSLSLTVKFEKQQVNSSYQDSSQYSG